MRLNQHWEENCMAPASSELPITQFSPRFSILSSNRNKAFCMQQRFLRALGISKTPCHQSTFELWIGEDIGQLLKSIKAIF